MPVSYDDILSDLKKRIYKPVYFLAGEEPYYIDLISDYIEENVLPATERDFNQTIVYAEDTSVPAIIDAARKFPMMASHQVIIVKEAQNLKKIDDLLLYAEKPLNSTILVLCHKYKPLDKRFKLYKVLDSGGQYFESKKLRDYEVPGWIERYLMTRGIKAEPAAGAMLTEYLGTDLHKIVNELNKLLILLPKGKPLITAELIEKNIGISKEYNNFELQKAIGDKDALKANRIIRYFADNPNENPIVVTISSLFSQFSKLLIYQSLTDKSRNNAASVLKINPYFVKDYEDWSRKYNLARSIYIISLLRTYDLRSKGFGDAGTDQGDLLKELVYKIIHL